MNKRISLYDKLTASDDGVFCVLPFTHLYVHSSENTRVCCTFMPGPTTINRKENTTLDFKDIWSSEYYKDIRKKILNGEKIPGCSKCYKNELNSGTSDRSTFNKRYYSLIRKDPKNTDIVLDINFGNQYKTPLDLDLRPGNLCNLQCRMCGPSSSSQLNREFKKMPKTFMFTPFNEKLQSNWTTDENLEFILRNVDKGKRIKFLGGEPTIMPEVQQLLNLLIKAGKNKNVELAFTSNLTNVNKKFLNTISKFNHVDINISMDGVGKTLEYIRHPINWEQMQKNIITFSKIDGIAPHGKFDIQFTTQAYNIHNILDTLRWIKSINSSGKLGNKRLLFCAESLEYPKFWKYDVLPKAYRDRHIQRVLLNPIMKEDFVVRLQDRLETILCDDEEEDPSGFLKHTIYYDISRNQCMKDYLPELWNLYENQYNKIRREIEDDVSSTL